MNTSLNNEVKTHRIKNNLTQAKLAELAGITRKSVNAIETNKMVPSVLLALLLANVLDVAVEELFSLG